MSIIGGYWEDELIESMERSRPERKRLYKVFKQKVNELVEELDKINQKYDATATLYNQKNYLECLERGFMGLDFCPFPQPRPTFEKNQDLEAITKLRKRYNHLVEDSNRGSLLGTISLIKSVASDFCDTKLVENIDSLETRINYTLDIVEKTKTIDTS